MEIIGNYILVAIFSSFIVLLFFQVKKMWKIKITLDVFLSDLKNLNKNINQIINFSENRCINISNLNVVEEKICENCKNRVTYLDFSFENIFYYKCRLNNKDIALNNTCKNYQKDLQNSKI